MSAPRPREQIFGLTVFNVALLTYSIIQITEIRDVFDLATTDSTTTTTTAGATGLRAIPVELLSALLPTAIGVGQAGYAVLSWFVFREFGWQTYKALGADRTLKKAFERYNVFCCLCKFDGPYFLLSPPSPGRPAQRLTLHRARSLVSLLLHRLLCPGDRSLPAPARTAPRRRLTPFKHCPHRS